MKIAKILAVAAAAATVGAASVCTFAEQSPAGYVYFCAQKSTIGQGLTVKPEKVPYYDGESGIDAVNRAAEILSEDSGYGPYITAFADSDNGGEIPAEIAAVCPEIGGRNAEGYLSAMDYTAEGGWTYFINDEYASVGIGDYAPTDGDVVCFRFTVYGYGADLGVDNSSWGGAAALKPMINDSELIRLCAEAEDGEQLEAALEVLGNYSSTQEDIDSAAAALKAASEKSDNAENTENTDNTENTERTDAPEKTDAPKESADTGIEGVAVGFGAVIIAGAFIALSKKR